jgi:hypothetical protein
MKIRGPILLGYIRPEFAVNRVLFLDADESWLAKAETSKPPQVLRKPTPCLSGV